MPEFSSFGKLLMILGASLFLFGAFLAFGGRMFRLGRLPGDILVRRGNFTFYFPVLTCLILSVVISFIMRFFHR